MLFFYLWWNFLHTTVVSFQASPLLGCVTPSSGLGREERPTITSCSCDSSFVSSTVFRVLSLLFALIQPTLCFFAMTTTVSTSGALPPEPPELPHNLLIVVSPHLPPPLAFDIRVFSFPYLLSSTAFGFFVVFSWLYQFFCGFWKVTENFRSFFVARRKFSTSVFFVSLGVCFRPVLFLLLGLKI